MHDSFTPEANDSRGAFEGTKHDRQTTIFSYVSDSFHSFVESWIIRRRNTVQNFTRLTASRQVLIPDRVLIDDMEGVIKTFWRKIDMP